VALRRKGARGQRTHELFPGFTDIVEIGIGSLATVYRAREVGTNRLVALKLLNVRDASPRSIESFERESIALGALSSHPNIVTLYRTFRIPDGRPVLVLELCTGVVADRLRGGAGLPVTDAVSIGIKIAGALETAHRGGILHRDVKPQNILVTEFGEPALADFGVAMLQSATQTTAGLFDFTTLHAAPELLEGGGTSAATDVYELASTLYQLIAGQSAFRAYEGESPASVILRILRDPVRPLSGMDVPVTLSDLLIRAMSKKMDERPPTAAEFAAELADVEIAQGWNRTQFLIRDVRTGLAPAVTRMPDAVPRGVPSTLASSAPMRPDAIDELHALLHVEPESASDEPASEPTPADTETDWSTPTIVPVAGWTPPPAELHSSPSAGPPPVPDPDTWWSAPPPSASRAPDVPLSAEAPAPPPVHEPDLPPAPRVEPAPQHDPFPAQQQPVDWSGFAPPSGRRRREPIEIDDEFFPARRPAVQPPRPPAPGDVPVWAVRAPAPADPAAVAEPQFSQDRSFDPASLRRRATIRKGAGALVVDDAGLRLRRWFRSRSVPWSDVHGFETHFDTSDESPAGAGHLVALTTGGPVELPGTARSIADLRYIHALLDAYRIRAQRMANS
jgi:serine/threonine protein kinase